MAWWMGFWQRERIAKNFGEPSLPRLRLLEALVASTIATPRFTFVGSLFLGRPTFGSNKKMKIFLLVTVAGFYWKLYVWAFFCLLLCTWFYNKCVKWTYCTCLDWTISKVSWAKTNWKTTRQHCARTSRMRNCSGCKPGKQTAETLFSAPIRWT